MFPTFWESANLRLLDLCALNFCILQNAKHHFNDFRVKSCTKKCEKTKYITHKNPCQVRMEDRSKPWFGGDPFFDCHLETPESPGTPYKGAHRSN